MGQVRSQKAKQFGIGNNLDKNAGFRMEKWRASFRVAVTMDPCGICDNGDRKKAGAPFLQVPSWKETCMLRRLLALEAQIELMRKVLER